jgi:hypothetical protein
MAADITGAATALAAVVMVADTAGVVMAVDTAGVATEAADTATAVAASAVAMVAEAEAGTASSALTLPHYTPDRQNFADNNHSRK